MMTTPHRDGIRKLEDPIIVEKRYAFYLKVASLVFPGEEKVDTTAVPEGSLPFQRLISLQSRNGLILQGFEHEIVGYPGVDPDPGVGHPGPFQSVACGSTLLRMVRKKNGASRFKTAAKRSGVGAVDRFYPPVGKETVCKEPLSSILKKGRLNRCGKEHVRPDYTFSKQASINGRMAAWYPIRNPANPKPAQRLSWQVGRVPAFDPSPTSAQSQ